MSKIRVTIEARDCTWTDWTDRELAHLAWHAAGEKTRAQLDRAYTFHGAVQPPAKRINQVGDITGLHICEGLS
jgi:hypothetical protein